MQAALRATEPKRGTPPTQEEVAAAFPHLEIMELIGHGGMGSVFKARQPRLQRFVALKILPVVADDHPTFLARFEREAQALARLNHPNIVSIFDFGQCGGFFYLMMEYVDGVNLRQAMQAGPIGPQQALELVPKICEALQYAHDEGVLHRDIKPENLLLDQKGRIKLADFGIAKLTQEPEISSAPDSFPDALQTQAGASLGTPNYMAPEQKRNPAEVDHRADIYSLGVVFYEMLTGKLPAEAFVPPSQTCASGPRVDAIVRQALQQNPAQRQASASVVKTQVDSVASLPPAATGRFTPEQRRDIYEAVWYGGWNSKTAWIVIALVIAVPLILWTVMGRYIGHKVVEQQAEAAKTRVEWMNAKQPGAVKFYAKEPVLIPNKAIEMPIERSPEESIYLETATEVGGPGLPDFHPKSHAVMPTDSQVLRWDIPSGLVETELKQTLITMKGMNGRNANQPGFRLNVGQIKHPSGSICYFKLQVKRIAPPPTPIQLPPPSYEGAWTYDEHFTKERLNYSAGLGAFESPFCYSFTISGTQLTGRYNDQEKIIGQVKQEDNGSLTYTGQCMNGEESKPLNLPLEVDQQRLRYLCQPKPPTNVTNGRYWIYFKPEQPKPVYEGESNVTWTRSFLHMTNQQANAYERKNAARWDMGGFSMNLNVLPVTINAEPAALPPIVNAFLAADFEKPAPMPEGDWLELMRRTPVGAFRAMFINGLIERHNVTKVISHQLALTSELQSALIHQGYHPFQIPLEMERYHYDFDHAMPYGSQPDGSIKLNIPITDYLGVKLRSLEINMMQNAEEIAWAIASLPNWLLEAARKRSVPDYLIALPNETVLERWNPLVPAADKNPYTSNTLDLILPPQALLHSTLVLVHGGSETPLPHTRLQLRHAAENQLSRCLLRLDLRHQKDRSAALSLTLMNGSAQAAFRAFEDLPAEAAGVDWLAMDAVMGKKLHPGEVMDIPLFRNADHAGDPATHELCLRIFMDQTPRDATASGLSLLDRWSSLPAEWQAPVSKRYQVGTDGRCLDDQGQPLADASIKAIPAGARIHLMSAATGNLVHLDRWAQKLTDAGHSVSISQHSIYRVAVPVVPGPARTIHRHVGNALYLHGFNLDEKGGVLPRRDFAVEPGFEMDSLTPNATVRCRIKYVGDQLTGLVSMQYGSCNFGGELETIPLDSVLELPASFSGSIMFLQVALSPNGDVTELIKRKPGLAKPTFPTLK